MFLLSHTQGAAFFKPPALSGTACRPAQCQTVHGKERILLRIADLCVSASELLNTVGASFWDNS